ncbi:HAMP domain-containing histidine kinase [bacterium]|nr:HAMP domain-containing histidine kinase [bacterium]
MKIIVKLSDKVLLIIFLFASGLLFTVQFVIGGSLAQIFVLSYIVYNFMFVMAYLVSYRFSKRITDLTFKIEAMAAGDISKRLRVAGYDEISQLTNAMNELMSRLQTGVAQDVSTHKELAQAKSDFVTLASHQLRTPLSIIKWYIDFFITGDAGKLTDGQLKYLKEVYKSNERLIELVNALLDVSRIDVGTFSIEPEPTDIIEKAKAAISKFKAEIYEKKINLELNFDELPKINLDPRLTQIVFENIFSNAVKYTPENGSIRFEIKKTVHDILIKISDTGCGIPREQQPKIFTKLFRADNVRRIESVGTGLGLYIAKAVIEKSGGKVWFQSPSLDLLLSPGKKDKGLPLDKRDQGTTFFITIPLKGMKKKYGTKKLTSLEH